MACSFSDQMSRASPKSNELTAEHIHEHERIYIGGLNPLFLKPSDVIHRLQDTLPDIALVGEDSTIDDTKSFLHVNVRSLRGDDEKAFHIISKAYNNVKWKGCRITIQEARPHFLQRLENERRERSLRMIGVKTPGIETTTTSTSITTPLEMSKRCRRLRIRERYGTEAHCVDTKPCETTDWESFEKIVRQLRIRRNRSPNRSNIAKKSHGTHFNKKQAFYSRAVHLRFEENAIEIIPTSLSSMQGCDGTKDSSETDSVGSSTKSEEVGAMSNVVQNVVSSRRMEQRSTQSNPNTDDWSTDESDDDETDGSEDNGEASVGESEASSNSLEQASKRSNPRVYDWSTDDIDDDESVDHETNSIRDSRDKDVTINTVVQDEIVLEAPSKSAISTEGENKYSWSSDESDQGFSNQASPTKLQPTISEFESGDFISDDDDDEVDGNALVMISRPSSNMSERIESNDFEKDVEKNLNVLLQLFPDIKGAAPKHIVDVKSSSTNSWNALPMQRYDPTMESSKQFELTDPTKTLHSQSGDICNNSEEQNNCDQNDDASSEAHDPIENVPDSEVENGVEESTDKDESEVLQDGSGKTTQGIAGGNIYNESQLQEVFRKARESGEGGGFQVSSLFVEQSDELTQTPTAKTTGSFSFGFNIESMQIEEPDIATGFVSSDAKTEEGNTTDDYLTQPFYNAKDGIGKDLGPSLSGKSGPQRRGLIIPESAVNYYYNKFFELNEGVAIQQDPERFHNDETVKADWQKERHSLTQDWKRKRKYALSRLQKNNKFRK